MLAVVKKPHTSQTLFKIKGEIPAQVLSFLEHAFGQDVEVIEDDETPVNLFETDWYQDIKHQVTLGEIVRMYRENLGMTQAELGQKLGNLTRQKISDMEHNRRSISKEVAKRLSQIFGVKAERFLYGI
ncbi:MAG: helix-turn-helix transcriptional regulator [Deltaproteobacteria bacterium]|nr:helix-turn-helix transcriptional regulator [Deltaproteobacteria bacterium]